MDLKQLPEWKSAYFIFDGHIVREDAPGNIAYGIAGNVMGFSDNTLYYACLLYTSMCNQYRMQVRRLQIFGMAA